MRNIMWGKTHPDHHSQLSSHSWSYLFTWDFNSRPCNLIFHLKDRVHLMTKFNSSFLSSIVFYTINYLWKHRHNIHVHKLVAFKKSPCKDHASHMCWPTRFLIRLYVPFFLIKLIKFPFSQKKDHASHKTSSHEGQAPMEMLPRECHSSQETASRKLGITSRSHKSFNNYK